MFIEPHQRLPPVLKAQQELETEGLKGEFDRTQATQTLETTLDKLLDHLEEKNVQEPAEGADGEEILEGGLQAARGRRNLAPKQPGSTRNFSHLCVACPPLHLHPFVLTAISCISISFFFTK